MHTIVNEENWNKFARELEKVSKVKWNFENILLTGWSPFVDECFNYNVIIGVEEDNALVCITDVDRPLSTNEEFINYCGNNFPKISGVFTSLSKELLLNLEVETGVKTKNNIPLFKLEGDFLYYSSQEKILAVKRCIYPPSTGYRRVSPEEFLEVVEAENKPNESFATINDWYYLYDKLNCTDLKWGNGKVLKDITPECKYIEYLSVPKGISQTDRICEYSEVVDFISKKAFVQRIYKEFPIKKPKFTKEEFRHMLEEGLRILKVEISDDFIERVVDKYDWGEE